MMEFPRAKKINVIDWTKYPSKTTHAIPQWRKQEEINLPDDIPNRLAINLCNQIEANKINIAGRSIHKDYETLVTEETQNHLYQQFPNPRNNHRYYNNNVRTFRGGFNRTTVGNGRPTRGSNNRSFSGRGGYTKNRGYLNRSQNTTRQTQSRGRIFRTSYNSSTFPQGSREANNMYNFTPNPNFQKLARQENSTPSTSNVNILQTFT